MRRADPAAQGRQAARQSAAFAFADHRPAAAAQRRLQAQAGASPQALTLQALQAMADRRPPTLARGVLARANGAPAPRAGTVQRTAGIVHADQNSWVLYSQKGGHGPYAIANIDDIDAALLRQGVVVDYKNLGKGQAWINSIGEMTFGPPPEKEKKKDEKSPIDLGHTVGNTLGIGKTDKIDSKDRPWLRGTSFKVDFGEELGSVTVDGFDTHSSLHRDSDKSRGFRGNSVKLSMSLHYQDAEASLKQHDFSVKGFQKFHSADFGRYTEKDLNDMYAIGRLIGSTKYNTQGALKDVAARYHSERDMVVKAEQMDSQGFAKAVADEVNGILGGEERVPKLLMLHLHSHELRICDDCYNFLDAFMQGGWIGDVKNRVINGEHLKITMFTSADQPHTVLAGKVNNDRPEGATIGIAELPRILNMGVLKKVEEKKKKKPKKSRKRKLSNAAKENADQVRKKRKLEDSQEDSDMDAVLPNMDDEEFTSFFG